MPRALLALALFAVAGCRVADEPPSLVQSDSSLDEVARAPTEPTPSPSVYRLVGDLDGDGRDDYALGEACGVHGLCPFDIYRAAPDRGFKWVGSVPLTYDYVRLCRDNPPRLVTILRYGTEYERLEYAVASDSVWVVRSDTSSLASGGPPASWAIPCAEDLIVYEATEADLAARGDSAWQRLGRQF